MTERPIIFSAPMVRAILERRKSQTRRVVKRLALQWLRMEYGGFDAEFVARPENGLCPYGVPGDRLWVRETWAVPHQADHLPPRLALPYQFCVHYAASEDRGGLLWRPSIHMPRWANRILLEVTAVRVERLQEIKDEDCIAEGISLHQDHHHQPRSSNYGPYQTYRDLWNQINGPDSWDANPWVWVIDFQRIKM